MAKQLCSFCEDKQMQNEKEKELIRLASAKGGRGGAILYLCGEY